ncbi:MAG: sugar transferase [Chloroflexota bacterium]|nr:MAG: sugar transferase [Chloroflexota bacterium]
MESTQQSVQLIAETPLKAKIRKASRSVPRQMQWRLYTAGLIIADLLMLGFAFLLAYLIRFELLFQFFYHKSDPKVSYYQTVVFFLTLTLLVIFLLLGLYDREKLLGGTLEYSMIFNGITLGMMLLIAVGFLDPNFSLARGWLLMAWFFALFFAMFGRFAIRRVIYSLRHKGYFLTSALIVGANNEGLSLAEQLTSWRSSGFHIVGFVDKKLPPGSRVLNDLYVLGTVDHLSELIARHDIEELILASSAISSRDRMLDIFQKYGVSSDVNVRMSSGLYEIITTGLTVKEFAYVPLVGVNKVRLTGVDEFLKYSMDILLAIPALLALGPMMLLIALAIKLESPGSIIYRRRVMGMNGEEFDAFKFRTMYEDGDEILKAYPQLQRELSNNFKLKEDPRVTRIGKFLRQTSLDELPQLINVLRREMSMVGPRIITPAEVAKYEKWDINLMTVRPGITGLWQVSGRSDVTYEERVRLDMHYIRNWSIWLDIQLLVQTIPAVIRKRGAY